MIRNTRLVELLPIMPTIARDFTFSQKGSLRVEGTIVAETENYRVLILPIECGIEVNQTPFDTRFDPVVCDDPKNCGNLSHQYDPHHDPEKLMDNVVRTAYEQDRNERKLSNRLRAKIKNLISPEKPKSPAQIEAEEEEATFAEIEKNKAEKAAIASATLKLNEAILKIENVTLSLTSPDHETTYVTVDLSPIVPEGWDVKIEHLAGKTFGYFGIVVFHPDHLDEVAAVRSLTNADYREPGTAPCGQTPSENCENETSGIHLSFEGEKVGFRVEDMSTLLCERELGHAGNHQTVFKDSYFRWDELRVTNLYYRNDIYSWDGSCRPAPVLEFAFKNICSYCGFVSAGHSSGTQTCISCSTWEDRLHDDGGAKRFIVEGNLYYSKTRELTGETFRVKNSDGSEWLGELYGPIRIPDWWRVQFPDNAVFLEN